MLLLVTSFFCQKNVAFVPVEKIGEGGVLSQGRVLKHPVFHA